MPRMITITGLDDVLQPESAITINGIRNLTTAAATFEDLGPTLALTSNPLLTLPASAQATFWQGAMGTIDAAGSLVSPTVRPGG